EVDVLAGVVGPEGLHAHVAGERGDAVLGRADELGAALGGGAVGERQAVDAPAGPVPGLQDDHRPPGGDEWAAGGQAGHPGADHDDVAGVGGVGGGGAAGAGRRRAGGGGGPARGSGGGGGACSERSRAAVRPASPAPTTTTSAEEAEEAGAVRAAADGAAAAEAAAPAAAPAAARAPVPSSLRRLTRVTGSSWGSPGAGMDDHTVGHAKAARAPKSRHLHVLGRAGSGLAPPPQRPGAGSALES